MIRLLVWWALLTGLYFGLISTVAGWELWLGGGLGVLAAAVAVLTHSAERGLYKPAWGWARWLLALPAAIVLDTARIAVIVAQRLVLRRDVRGRFRRLELPPGTGARQQARHALTAVVLSATPGSVVADVTSDDIVLIHALGPPGSRLEQLVTR